MMIDMNEQIRESVRVALAKEDMSQTELADKVGATRQQVNQFIRGKGGNVHTLWQKIFDELGLELKVVAKGREG